MHASQDVGDCLIHPISCVGRVVGGLAGDAATSVFDAVAQEFAEFAEHATTWVWQQLDAATAVKLSGGQWDGVLQVTVEIGVLVCVLMLLLQVTVCAVRQDFAGLGRGLRGVMIAMLGTFASFVIVDSLLSVVDSMSSGVMQALAGTESWTELGSEVIHASTLTGGALGSAAMLLCALVMLLSSLVVWLALMVRKMLVIIGAAFAPIAFGGAPFDVTSAWVRRWIEFTVALVFSKLVLVILFGIGLQIELGLGEVGTGTAQEITQMMTGLLVMAVAGFAPWLALQFVHWAGGSMQQIQRHAQSAQAGGQAAIAAPQRLYAGAQAGFGGLALAAGRLSSGASWGGSSGASGTSGGSDGSGGGRGGGGGATAAAVSAFESGRNQTAQALPQSGGPSGDGKDDGDQQQRAQGGQPRGERGGSGSGSGEPSGPGGSPVGDDGDGGTGPSGPGGASAGDAAV